jgi:hypothetical protein
MELMSIAREGMHYKWLMQEKMHTRPKCAKWSNRLGMRTRYNVVFNNTVRRNCTSAVQASVRSFSSKSEEFDPM